MNILVIGGGGREHALAWKLSQSPKVDHVYVAPGNAGTAREKKLTNIAVSPSDFESLSAFAAKIPCELTIVGPEGPLVAGIVDFFKQKNLACLGPSKRAARLEGSKSFTKNFLRRHQIPTGQYSVFTDTKSALAHIHKIGTPIVVKADGLAAGKGVVVATTLSEAEKAVRDMLYDNRFGEAGAQVVVEEFLEGEEASFIALISGDTIIPMATSQDHKRIGEGDTGANTGGMGAYSPAPVVTNDISERVMREIIVPTVQGMKSEGNDYLGFLYAGLMIDSVGNPKVIEYNCRLGDPETQPILMRLRSDLALLCLDACRDVLRPQTLDWDPRPAIGIVLASAGYPNSVTTGHPIFGLDKKVDPSAKVFHAASRLDGENIITDGGRVLCVSAMGDNLSSATEIAYELINEINWEGCYFRRDIGWRAIKR